MFGLLARRAWLFWATLAQLAALPRDVVADRGLLLPEPDVRAPRDLPARRARWADEAERPEPRRGSWTGREPLVDLRAPRRGFSLLQLVPHAFPGDSGDHRRGAALRPPHVRRAGGVRGARHAPRRPGGTRRVRIETARGSARVRCDPIVHFNVARALCRQGAVHGRWTDLDLSLRSRRTTEPELRLSRRDRGRSAGRDPTYDLWRPNAWIMRSDVSAAPPGDLLTAATPRLGRVSLRRSREVDVHRPARRRRSRWSLPAKVPSKPGCMSLRPSECQAAPRPWWSAPSRSAVSFRGRRSLECRSRRRSTHCAPQDPCDASCRLNSLKISIVPVARGGGGGARRRQHLGRLHGDRGRLRVDAVDGAGDRVGARVATP